MIVDTKRIASELERLGKHISKTFRESNEYLKELEKYANAVQPILESEVNPMTHNVTIKKTEKRVIEEYWELHAIKSGSQSNLMISNSELCIGKGNLIIERKELKTEPTLEEIAQFLSDSNADFVSVEHNYRFEPDLPFC